MPIVLSEVDGFMLLPGLFAVEELGWLAQEGRALVARLSGRPKAGVPAWSSEEAPDGALFDIDVYEEAFRRLVAHPRLLAPARERLREALYVHRTRLVVGRGDQLQRSDFDTWRRVAGIPEPRLVTAAVALTAGAVKLDGARVGALTGSVLLLDPRSSYVVEYGDWFFITYNALSNQPVGAQWVGVGSFRPRPLDSVYADDCLWPSPMACAG